MEQQSPGQPRVIFHQAAATAAEVRNLVRLGYDALAWERLRSRHPADMGAILTAIPRAGRGSLLRVMGPESVAWMLRHYNVVQPTVVEYSPAPNSRQRMHRRGGHAMSQP